jgi:serine/threonine protein kinase
MGVVYLAEDRAGGQVALKVIHPHLASHEEFRERFRSEVALARQVARFCTAPILDSDTDADPPYIATEFIDGPTLAAAIAEQTKLSGSQLHALGVGMASALTAIHGAGIVHRDLKPSNVVLSRFGPRVIDFGIARAADAVTGVTKTGQSIGSPSYMAPEQLRGEPITPAADIFAWGAVMAFAGTGRQPFGTAAEAVMYRVVYGEADLEGLDPQLTELVEAALSKTAADRPTAQQLLDTLVHDERGGRPASAPPAGPSTPPAAPTAPASPVPWHPPATDWSSAPPQQPRPAPWHAPPPYQPFAGGSPGASRPASAPPGSGSPSSGPPSSGPPSAPPSSGPPNSGPPRASRRWVLYILLSMFLVCCVGGGGSLGGFAYLGHTTERDDTVKALEGYLEQLKRKQYGEAYKQLCDKAKAGVDLELFTQRLTDASPLVSYDIDEDSMDGQFFELGFNIDVEQRYADGGRRTGKYYVESDDIDVDKYVICPRN